MKQLNYTATKYIYITATAIDSGILILLLLVLQVLSCYYSSYLINLIVIKITTKSFFLFIFTTLQNKITQTLNQKRKERTPTNQLQQLSA